MNSKFIQQLVKEHSLCSSCPSPAEVAQFFTRLLGLFYPDFADHPLQSEAEIKSVLRALRVELSQLLTRNPHNDQQNVDHIVASFFDDLPSIYNGLNLDLEAIYSGDPASTSRREIIRCYPGFYAIAAYRVANRLHRLNVDDMPRIITEHAHEKTGIDIHPGATIGSSFCIDHGTGIVIGATADIHDHVKIYQGVTLGALSVNKSDAGVKRHPTIASHCVIYAGATILGGHTVIGRGSVIGGNVWVTKSVPPASKLYYQAKMNVEGKEETDTIVFKEFAR